MTTILVILLAWIWGSFAIGGVMLARADYLNGVLSGRRALFYAIVGAVVPPIWGIAVLSNGWDAWRDASSLARDLDEDEAAQ